MFTSATLAEIGWAAAKFALVALPTLIVVNAVLGWVERGKPEPWE